MLSETMLFEDAAVAWLAGSATLKGTSDPRVLRKMRETTEVSYRQYCESLVLFFNGMKLVDIHHGNVLSYQRTRLYGEAPFIRKRRPHEDPKPSPVQPKKVNQETAVLRRIMLRAKCWTPELEEEYRPLLEEESEAQRVLEPEEQERWLDTAKSKTRWEVVYWYSLLALGTTMSTNELRYLRVGDVNLKHQLISVAKLGIKCKGRGRTIPLLTAEELWAAEKLLERANTCGSVNPQHYIFPFRARHKPWQPDKPMSTSGIKREWQEVRDATGLVWFRQYDLRHTGGTRMAEAGIRPEIIKARMGHLTNRMHDHYMHISEAAQRREMARASTLRFAPRAIERERRNIA